MIHFAVPARGLLQCGAWLAAAAILVWPSWCQASDVCFQRDVLAVLSKAGCNAGTCHGNLHGKGGFRLSLRGEDPAFDYLSLTRDQLGRRVNAAQPAKSLVLLKPTSQVVHEGGRRFARDAPEYRVLLEWIEAGMPNDSDASCRLASLVVTPSSAVVVEPQERLQLAVTARFEDGSTRDVSNWAVYEPAQPIVAISPAGLVERRATGETTILVRYLDQQVAVPVAMIPARPNFTPQGPRPRNRVDELVFGKLRALRINPGQIASDQVFLRRACLDLLGIYPSAEMAREFLSDRNPDKRRRLVDSLLQRPEFASHWALRWCDSLRVEEKTLDRKGVVNLHHWLTRAIDTGMPLDQLARKLVAAQGSTYLNPAANYYRAARDPLARAEGIAQVFLGIRLQCARCHNHPFDRWRQSDYYDWAAIFASVDYKILENQRRDRNDQHEFDGEQIVFVNARRKLTNPRTGSKARPRVFDANETWKGDARESLERTADWMVDPKNPFFARAQANRVWAHLMGRGIVDPPDDFRANNPPSNPALLEYLAVEFVDHDYDLRHLIRLIMDSATYQLAAPDQRMESDPANFSHVEPRRLTAEQLLDAICQVLDAPARFNGYPLGTRAGAIAGVQAVSFREQSPSPADRFLRTFGKPPRLLACDCERSVEPTLHQALTMVSGELVNELLKLQPNRLDALQRQFTSGTPIVEELYWIALGRAPSQRELQATVELYEQSPDKRAALEDIAWGLLNSTEFILRP